MTRARRFSRLLSRFYGTCATPPRSKQKGTRRLFLESLEDRRVMATIASSFDAGSGTLTLSGTDAAADTLNIALAGGTLTLGTTAGNTINLTSLGLLDAVGPQVVPLGGANVTKLVIDLKGSADTINLAGTLATPLLTILDINDTGAAGADAVNVSGTINLGGSLSVAGIEATTLSTNVTTTAGQTYGGDVTLGADVTLVASAIGFNGKVNGGGNDLTLTGNATFGNEAADTVTGVEALSVSGTTTIRTNTISTSGTQTYTGPTLIAATVVSAAVTTTDDAVVFGSTLSLGSPLAVNAGTGDITFTGVVSGGTALEANSTGTTRFLAAIGAGTPLTSVTTNAGGTTEINGGTVNTGALGILTFNDSVSLGADTSLTANTVTFNGTLVGNGRDLTITSHVVFGDDASDAVTGIDVLVVNDSTTINTNTVSTTGTQTYTETLTIGATAGTATLTTTDDAVFVGLTSLLASNLSINAGAGDITFTAEVDGGFALSANSTGTTRFLSDIGTTTPLASISTDAGGGTVLNDDHFRTTGAQTYNDAVTLGDAPNVTSTSGGAVTFASTVNGPFGLSVNTLGAATFGGAVGGVTPLVSLFVDADAQVNGGSVTTTVAQSFDKTVSLGANTTLTNTGSGPVILREVNGAFSLNVNNAGATEIRGLGVVTPLTTVATDAAGDTTVSGELITTGQQNYQDGVVIEGKTVFTSTGAGTITFASTVNNSLIHPAQNLTVETTGTTTFGGLVGGAIPLASVTTDAGGVTQINGSGVSTTGAQTYNDAVTLGANTTLTAGTVTFNGTVVGNSNDLTVTGNAVFGNAAADTVTAVDVLAVSGTTTINTNTISTDGTQTYTGAVTINAATTLTTTNDNVLFGNTTTLNADLTVSAGTGDVTFTGAVNGGNDLTANSTGTTRFLAAVGTLASVTTDAGGTTAINGGSVNTSAGPQNYNDNVTLGANTTLTASTVTFNGTVVGNANDLTITGNAVFGNAAADTVTTVDALSVSGTTAINTNTISTEGAQTFAGAATIGAAATLTTTNDAVLFGNTTTLNSNLTVNAGTGDITFTGIVSGAFALAANSTGTTRFLAAAGPLASVTTDAGGTTAINGGSVNTGAGPQTYHDNATLGANTTLTAGTVTFNGTVVGNANDLAITASAVFGNAAADTVTGVDVLSVSGTTTINTNTISTDGTQTYTGAVTIGALAGTATLSTTNDAVLFGSTTTLNSGLVVNAGSGSITFTGAVNGGNALTANTTGTTTFTSTVGAGTPLSSLTTTAGGTTQINGGGAVTVRTTAAQTYNDPVVLGNHTALLGGAGSITFISTVNGAFDLTTTAAGTTAFTAAVGGATPLRNFDINAGGTTQLRADVTTSLNQTYGNAVVVGNAATHLVTLTGSNVQVENTASLNGSAAGESVKIVAAGNIAFDGPVGITQPLDKLTLQAGVAATQTAPISGSGLQLLGAGSFALTNAGNDFATLAGAVAGTVQFTDATALTIGAVNATTGLSAAAVTVTTGGPLTVASNVTAGGAIQLRANEAPAVDTNNVTVNAAATVNSTSNNVTIQAGDHIRVLGSVQAATGTINLLSVDGVDAPAAGAGGVTGTVFTISGTLNAPQINVTGEIQNDVFDIEFAGIIGPVAVRGAANDATLAPGFVRDTGAADVPAITKFSKAPFFLPTLKTFVVGDQLFIDDNGATPLANFNRDYTIDGVQIRRVGDAAAFITFPDHDLELLKLSTGRGNNDVTVNLATGGALPEIVQIDTAGSQIGPADDRFQVLGTGGGDKISIGDMNLHASLISPALGPIRAHFELNGFQRQWVQSFAGEDVIDNISSVPGLLDGGVGKDAINSIVNHSSSFKLAKKIEKSLPKDVTLVLGNEDADKLYVGTGAKDKTVAQTPLMTALRGFPDRGITFLLGDQFVQGNQLKDVPLNKQKGDNYASSASAFQHGFIARSDFSDPNPAPNTSLGLFRFGAGDKVKFSKTIAWLKAQLFVGAAVPFLLKSLDTQVQQYVRPVTDAAGEAEPIEAFEEGPSPLMLDARVDVNRDGHISARDALTIINDLNTRGVRRLTADELAEAEDDVSYEEGLELKPTLDVNGDSNLTALDALLVINVLNAFGTPTADSTAATDEVFEGFVEEETYPTYEEPAITTSASSTSSASASAPSKNSSMNAIYSLLASDWEAAQRRRQQAAPALIQG